MFASLDIKINHMKLNGILILVIILLFGNLSCKNKTDNHLKLTQGLDTYIKTLENEFDLISAERKTLLEELSMFIAEEKKSDNTGKVIFICTHNSRRSHMSQLWAQVASYYYNIENIYCYSGGTEITAFNPRAVKALKKAGFQIEQMDSTSNPVYNVKYAEGVERVKGFSKKFSNEFNPQKEFIAVMTCSDADESCPLVPGAKYRVAIPYKDPKVSDNTPAEERIYNERSRQIAREMFYVFSKVNNILN